MSRYSRNQGETPEQFNARITTSEKASSERMASRTPKVRDEVAERKLGQTMVSPRGPRGIGPTDGGPMPTSVPSVRGAVKTPAGRSPAMARMKAAQEARSDKKQLIKSVSRSTGAGSIGGAPISIPNRGGTGLPSSPTKPYQRPENWYIPGKPGKPGEVGFSGGLSREYMDASQKREEAEYQARLASRKYTDANKPANNIPAPTDHMKLISQPMAAPRPIAKGGVVKKAAGGAAKVRKGMMTSEGTITHAMNKIRGK